MGKSSSKVCILEFSLPSGRTFLSKVFRSPHDQRRSSSDALHGVCIWSCAALPCWGAHRILSSYPSTRLPASARVKDTCPAQRTNINLLLHAVPSGSRTKFCEKTDDACFFEHVRGI